MRRIWAASPGGLILAAVHVGNNEAIAAGVASRGFPISVIADDTSFPELFELLRRQRAAWGFTLIPWRNLRAMFGVLRRREMLGLLVDWGYRSDGIPVRMFDAWTTLPAGPATLAAKTGSHILPVWIRRLPNRTFGVFWDAPIVVASNDPAELQRASQELADAMTGAIRAAPHQWYSFKPLWPAGDAEGADLERRARAMQAGRPDPGPGRDLPRDEADQVGIADAETVNAAP
jgi:KDO2-lipid IV(A) lauroyltransferase